MNTSTQLDGYKVNHKEFYRQGTSLIYSNLTARGSRIDDVNYTVFFGLQYYIKKHLIEDWNNTFFSVEKTEAVSKYQRRMDNYLGPDMVNSSHLEELHDLGYLPIKIMALPEGSIVPLRVPMLTIENTDVRFFWLTNALETSLSTSTWMPITVATIAHNNKLLLEEYADRTCNDRSFVPFQSHDFSMRGISSLESAGMSGAAHLLSSVGTDSVPAIDFLEDWYGANSDDEMVGVSVSANEHSVVTSSISYIESTLADEDSYVKSGMSKQLAAETYFIKDMILNIVPTGILSLVCDSYDFWAVVTKALPVLKDDIMSRDGKLVIRPDSSPTNPQDVICGWAAGETQAEKDGLIETLWNIFGGVVNEKGYKELDPHIGAIYGDGITHERMNEILTRLEAKGFASNNIVFGIGSFSYQYNTRDTFGMAVKSTAAVINGQTFEVFKDPKTDDGLKKSAKGFIRVDRNVNGDLVVVDQVSYDQTKNGSMKMVFLNGNLKIDQKLSDIRALLKNT